MKDYITVVNKYICNLKKIYTFCVDFDKVKNNNDSV